LKTLFKNKKEELNL